MQLKVQVPKNSRTNVITSKQTTNKVAPNIFRRFKVTKKVRLGFRNSKDSMKSKCYDFSGYKQRNNVNLVYLECKLQQDSYDWGIFKLKSRKMINKI